MYKKYFITFFFTLLSANNCFASFPIVHNMEDAYALSEQTKQPVLVIFGADWCKYCVKLKTDIETGIYAEELDNVIVCFLNVDKNKQIRLEYKISNLPDSRIISDKKEISSIIGYNKPKYKEWISNAGLK